MSNIYSKYLKENIKFQYPRTSVKLIHTAKKEKIYTLKG